LTVMAIGLLLIGLNPWIAPTSAYAEWTKKDRSSMASYLNNIAVAIGSIDCSR